ncbi:hypothetical protein GCM10010315_36740 [Streptomyces luteosporeus]|uniref:Transposase n=1 Tax=Streptomyces luteosporeus TaxID=173856 RepID=A0ABP6G8U5_9ACTN
MDKWQGGAHAMDVKVDVIGAMVDAQRRNSRALGRRSRVYRVAVLLLLVQILTLVAAVAESSAA